MWLGNALPCPASSCTHSREPVDAAQCSALMPILSRRFTFAPYAARKLLVLGTMGKNKSREGALVGHGLTEQERHDGGIAQVSSGVQRCATALVHSVRCCRLAIGREQWGK